VPLVPVVVALVGAVVVVVLAVVLVVLVAQLVALAEPVLLLLLAEPLPRPATKSSRTRFASTPVVPIAQRVFSFA